MLRLKTYALMLSLVIFLIVILYAGLWLYWLAVRPDYLWPGIYTEVSR